MLRWPALNAKVRLLLAQKQPAEQAPVKMKAVKPSMSDLAMELNLPPLSPTQPKASVSMKTKPMVQQTTTKRKAVEAPVSDSAMESNSPLLMPSQPKASSKSKGQKTATLKKRVDAVPSSDSPLTTAPSQALNPKPQHHRSQNRKELPHLKSATPNLTCHLPSQNSADMPRMQPRSIELEI